MFTISKYLNLLRIASPPHPSFMYIWRPWIPPEFSTLIWRALHTSLPTDDAVMRLAIPLASICQCCIPPNSENLDHILFSELVPSKVWHLFGSLCSTPPPASLPDLVRDWFVPCADKTYRSFLLLLVSSCIIWELWSFRNSSRWDNNKFDPMPKLYRWVSRLAGLTTKYSSLGLVMQFAPPSGSLPPPLPLPPSGGRPRLVSQRPSPLWMEPLTPPFLSSSAPLLVPSVMPLNSKARTTPCSLFLTMLSVTSHGTFPLLYLASRASTQTCNSSLRGISPGWIFATSVESVRLPLTLSPASCLLSVPQPLIPWPGQGPIRSSPPLKTFPSRLG